MLLPWRGNDGADVRAAQGTRQSCLLQLHAHQVHQVPRVRNGMEKIQTKTKDLVGILGGGSRRRGKEVVFSPTIETDGQLQRTSIMLNEHLCHAFNQLL